MSAAKYVPRPPALPHRRSPSSLLLFPPSPFGLAGLHFYPLTLPVLSPVVLQQERPPGFFHPPPFDLARLLFDLLRPEAPYQLFLFVRGWVRSQTFFYS